MTVKELKEELNKCPENAMVLAYDDMGSYKIDSISLVDCHSITGDIYDGRRKDSRGEKIKGIVLS